ncbi:hypothetical protein HMPREF1022_02895 [Desulfovibrio sp. 6_1_46AFAA]|uniref:hypothetical protein n=1 Tax=Desulfovibrio sp. 6_1_46AFAA TaxID=665942 RepID=UPI0002236D52|nr:hypothetical protein [Desulfovibrio sp. 6_1_46AFAA]EGW50073.1 hypothetical protein HMPREF1022_02895 [Desulfovibrio sp. 6_1_46AFAA]
MSEKITIRFAGVDDWSRVVFKGDNGRFYKTIDLAPDCGFDNLSAEEKQELLKSLHSCDGRFDGEPCSPCNLECFILAE